MEGATTSASTPEARPADHAIVIGGSMAGLVAARVLADHFPRVTIVDRDRFPAEPLPRAGVPQSRHVHVLLLGGKRTLEDLFPGLDAALAADGAPSMDLLGEFLVLGLGGWNCRFPSPYVMRTCSRPLLEWHVRRRLAAHPAIRFLEATRVVGLLADARTGRVTGVRVQPRGEESAPEQALDAALVVDAGGRDSRAPQWLQALGYQAPRETIVNSFLGYASRVYEPPPGFQARWKGAMLVAKAPDNRRGGVLWPLEGGRWIVTLIGIAHDYPPTDDDAFLAFARSLRSPLIYEAIKDARPLTPIHGYRRTENRWRHYERLDRWPDGFVVLGDAACAFNPVYGQGMTTAALGAARLDRCLREARGDAGMARRFQRELARVIATPWLMATGEDFRWSTTEGGQRSLQMRLLHRYIDQVLILNTQSTTACATFSQVAHLIDPPASFFKPRMLTQVLGRPVLAAITGRRRRDVPDATAAPRTDAALTPDAAAVPHPAGP
jgi:2-polyprenyl-6-methoxyphenol hydroxylase-like FAD-dependent oxidoreductase